MTSQTITLAIEPRGRGFCVTSETEFDRRSWGHSRNLDVTRMKAYLLARRIYQRTGAMVRVVERLRGACTCHDPPTTEDKRP